MSTTSLLRQSLMAKEKKEKQDSTTSRLRRSLEVDAGVAPGSFSSTPVAQPTKRISPGLAQQDEFDIARNRYRAGLPQLENATGQRNYAPVTLESLADSTVAPTNSQEQTVPKYVSPFAKNEDYAELSRYKSTKKEKSNSAPLAFLLPGQAKSSEYEDKWYEYVNRNKDVVDLTDADLAKMGASFSAANRSYLKQMTDEQIADYNYVYAKQGKEEADKFLDSLQKDLTAKQNEEFVERTQEYAREHPVASSAASVIAGPAKGLSLIGQLAEYADTGDIDPNSLSNRFVKQNQTIRQTVPENWGKVGQFLYGTGMSVLDNLYNMALTGAFGNIGGLGEGAQSLILGIMGSSAAADSTLTALENGYSADRALIQGAIAGGIEVLTEKVSLETLLSPNAFKDGTIKYLLKNMAAEGSEEGASTISNWVVDWIGDLITDENRSDFRQVFTAFKRGDTKEGWRKIGEMGLDLAQDVAGGALSGGVLAGGGSLVNLAANTITGRNANIDYSQSQIGNYVQESFNDTVGNKDASDHQQSLAKKAMNQFDQNGKVSNRTLGELMQSNAYMESEQNTRNNLLGEAMEQINSGKTVSDSTVKEILGNKRAVDFLSRNSGLQLQDNMTRPERFQAVRNSLNQTIQQIDEIQAPARKVVSEIRQQNELYKQKTDMVSEFAKTLGEQGGRTLMHMADNEDLSNITSLAGSYTKVYNEVKANPEVNLNEVSDEIDNRFTPQQLNTIYKSAVKDYEADLKKTGLSYEGETNAEETATGSQDSGTDGVGTVSLDSEVSTGSVAGRTAEVESRRKAADVRIESIRNNAALNSIAEVTSAEAGIPGGVNTDQAKTVRVLSESQWSALDTDTYNFLHELKDMGYEVKAWTGTALAYDEMSGKNAAVRGFIQGNTIGVRVDANLSARKIAYHEMFHDMVKTDSSLQADMVKKINERYGEGKLDTIVRDYVSQYGWTKASSEEILNEILADAYAGIDIYEDLEMNYEGATQVSADVRGFLSENGVKTRNGNNAGKFSRDSDGNNISPEQAEYFKDSKVRDRNGNLLTVYHGTPRGDFTVFDSSKIGSSTDYGWYGKGFYFTPNERNAKYYAGYLNSSRVMKGYLNLKNPYYFRKAKTDSIQDVMSDIMGQRFDTAEETAEAFTDWLKEEGYDGLVADGQYMALDSSQFKNADNVNPTSNPDVRYSTETALEQHGIELVDGTATKYSLDTWNETDKDRVLDALVKAGFSRSEASKWIDDVNSIAAIILGDRYRLDYDAADNQVMLKNNEEYVKTLDSSTLCAKRLLYQGTFNRITELLPDSILTPDDLIHIRKVMAEMGDTVPCGICYVESRRKTLSTFAGRWLNEVYKGETKVTMNDLTSTVGLEKLRSEHPDIYNDYTSWMRKRGTANPKIVELRTSYRNDISKLTKGQIAKIIRIGGLRVQSFSDFETVHLIDMMQAILDMSAKGLTSQAYTKVPNFAWAFGDTGIKINLSLIGKAQNGKLVFDSKEGMDINDAMKLRERYSDNVGTILVGANDESILLAMADDRIDFIIPFHRSGWSQSQFEDLGLSGYDDYQAYQNERHLDGSAISEGNLYPIDYWDYSKTGKENAERYLEICKEQGRIPKFERFLVDNGDGSWSLQPDGSTDGYWKMLIDFKMYNNQGIGAPQRAVTPTFNMEECERILNEYDGEGNRSLPVDEEAAQKFVEEYKAQHKGQFSRDTTYMDSEGSELSKEQAEYFKDSKIRDEDGNLQIVYHGTDADFTVFDRTKGRSTMDIQGSFFSPWDIDAGGYGSNVQAYYLNITNPAPESVAYKALNRFKGQNNAGVKAREYLESLGYDGVNNSDEEYIAFNPEQIKRVDNQNPTENPDIRYSRDSDQDNRVKANFGTMFSGTGTVDFALRNVINHSFAVEYDNNISAVYRMNNGDEIYEGDVRDAVKQGYIDDKEVDFLHASPVCKDYSAQKQDATERPLDISTAKAVADVIDSKKPKLVTIENVRGYKNSQAVKLIQDALDRNGYVWDEGTYKASDFGGATSRERYFIRAARDVDELPAIPAKKQAKSWYDATKDLIPDLKEMPLKEDGYMASRWNKLKESIDTSHPVLLLRGTKGGKLVYAEYDKPSPTIIASETEARIVMPDGRFLEASPRVLARIQGLPDEFQLPKQKTLANKVVGNGVPVELTQAVLGSLLPVISGENYSDIRFSRDSAPEFYSKLEREIEGYKGEKLGAASVTSYLKGKGVKDEEIKWTGIATFLEGKKSVSKAELLQYVRDNQIQIEEEDLGEGNTNWNVYKTPGGENYREILYRIPESLYINEAMERHWKGTTGVLAHARIQDFKTSNGNVLFVDEIQSDWHNEGQNKGYVEEKDSIKSLESEWKELLDRKDEIKAELDKFDYSSFDPYTMLRDGPSADEKRREALDDEYSKIVRRINEIDDKLGSAKYRLEANSKVPDAPFRNGTYIQYVLKDLLRKAAEGGYDYLAWTTGQMQEDRWSRAFADLYRIEYDQNIPKFLSKYGKQWGAKLTEITLNDEARVRYTPEEIHYREVFDSLYDFWHQVDPFDFERNMIISTLGNNVESLNAFVDEMLEDGISQEEIDRARELSAELDAAYEDGIISEDLFEEYDETVNDFYTGAVPAIPITDAMKESVLYEGQPRFSRDTTGMESELQKQNRELNKELKEVTERYHYFKDQLVLTKVRQATEKSANRVAKQLVKDYSSNVSADEIAKALREASKLVLNVKDDTDIDELQTQLKDALRPYAMQMVTNASELMNAEDVETQKSIRNDLRNGAGIIVTEQMKKDVPDWASFRKAQFGNMKLVSGPKTNIHDVYLELSQKYGEGYFPADVANESDMLQVIADVMADLSAIYDNPYTYGGANIAEAIESCTNDMMMSVVGSLEAEQPTFADKKKAEQKEALRKQAIKLRAEALERVKEQRDRTWEKASAKYKKRIKSIYDKRQQYELRGKIRKKVKDLSGKLLRPTDDKHIPYALQGAVVDLLSAINTGSAFDLDYNDSATHVERGTGMATRKTTAWARLQRQLSDLRDQLILDGDLFDTDDQPGILTDLSGLTNTSIDSMDTETLQKVLTVLRNCETAIRSYNQMISESKWAEISEACEAISNENADKVGRPEYQPAVERTIDLLTVDMATPEAYFGRMGAAGKTLFKMLRAAQDENIRMMSEAQKFSQDRGLYDLKLKNYERKMVTVRFGNRDVEMSKAQLMELYILNKREASRAHIEVGGILPEPVQKKWSLKKVTYSEPIRNVTQEDIAKAMSQLSPEDIKIAEAMQEFVSTVMTKHGNDAAMRVYGYKKFGEENYWPIRVNDQDLRTELGTVRTRARSVSKKGFTNAIKPNAKQSVVIGSIFDTFNEHVAEMSNYASHLAVMEDMKRIYNFTEKNEDGAIEVSTKYTLRNVFGPQGTKYFEKLMQDLSNGTVSEQAYFGGLIGRFKAAAVGSNLRVILQQPTAIFRAMDMISPKYLAQGFLRVKSGREKALKNAPIAQWKDWGYFDINTGRSTKNILFENSSTLDRVQNVLMAGAGLADSISWGALYSAVEFETKDLRPDLDPRSKAFDDVVSERFSDIVDHSQVVDGVLQRSGIMRSENAIDKMATSFMAEPTKQFNMLASAIYNFRHAVGENKAQAGKVLARTTAAMVFAGVLNAAVQSIVDALRNDDPEKDYWEKFLEKFTGEEDTLISFMSSNVGDFLNPAQYVPYAKDIVSIIQGYDVERMDISLINDLYTDAKSMVNSFSGKGKYSTTNNIINFMNTASKFLGLSIGNVKRDVAGIANTIAQETGSYVFEYRMSKFTYNLNQATNKGRFVEVLAKAYEAGDREAFNIIMNDLIKEDKFATTTMTTEEWIKKRLKDKHDIILK